MNKSKRIIATLMAAGMIAAITPTALATTTVAKTETAQKTGAGDYTANVQLTAAAPTFSVTVPTVINIYVNANGSVTCPDDVAITNNSSAAVKVSKVQMQNGEWTLVDYENELSTVQMGSNQLSFQLTAGKDNATTNGTGYTEAAELTHSVTENWDQQWIVNGTDGSLSIKCAAKASPVKDAISGATTVAHVIFTVGWASPAES
jgi:hypothetical protein